MVHDPMVDPTSHRPHIDVHEGQGEPFHMHITYKGHYNGLTPAQDERLAKLAEECAEVIKAICKIQRHGYMSRDPTKEGALTNRRDLEVEIADVANAVKALVHRGDIDETRVRNLALELQGRENDYMHHQGDKP